MGCCYDSIKISDGPPHGEILYMTSATILLLHYRTFVDCSIIIQGLANQWSMAIVACIVIHVLATS